MFHQLFRVATLAKFATAATLIAGAYGTSNVDMPESRPLHSSLQAEKTSENAVVTRMVAVPITEPTIAALTTSREEVRRPVSTAKPEKTAQPVTATKPVTNERYSFENLLKECVTRYTQHLDDAKGVCTAAMSASGLDADAFWAKYRSLMIPPTKPSTTAKPTTSSRPSSTPKPNTSVQLSPECIAKYEAAKAAKNGPSDAFEAAVRSFNESCRTSSEGTPKTQPVTSTGTFEALLKECVARYARAASNTKEACEAAIRTSGLDADAFWAKYRSLMIPPTKPSTTAKPTTSAQLSPECIAKYEAAKAAKNGPSDLFEAAVRSFNESCRTSSEGSR